VIWRVLIEPLLRWWPSYPTDWERRRMIAYERAAGRCEACGMPVGRIGLDGQRWRVIGAHVHHLRAIAAGGGHSIKNLSVRCARCHAAEHPGNRALRIS
jgi:hypothetical protein